MKTFELDLILPCFNPSEHWSSRVSSSVSSIRSLIAPSKVHIILINDGSKEDRWRVEAELLKETLDDLTVIELESNFGKGFALREGMRRSTSPYCVFTDVDFPYTEDTLIRLIGELTATNSTDIVIGQRSQAYYYNVPWTRVIISKAFRLFLRILYKFAFTDTQCGIKGFKAASRGIFLQTHTNRYLIDLEFLLLSSKLKYSISQVHAELRGGVVFSRLTIKALITELRSLVEILIRVFKTPAR